MTTVVNNPASGSNSEGNGFLVGAIILVMFVAVLLYFGIPAIQNMGPIQVNVPTPQVNVAAPQIAVPDKVTVETTEPVPAK